eukprot:EG_transcript_23426
MSLMGCTSLIDDPNAWAKQTATLHAVQAVTSEVACQSQAADGAYRGVRWLRDVLRSEDVQRRRSLSTCDAREAGLVRHRGLIVGDSGQWRGIGIAPRARCSVVLAVAAEPGEAPRPRCGRPACYSSLDLPIRRRLRSLVRCPSECESDSDDDI